MSASPAAPPSADPGPSALAPPDPWHTLGRFTPARIGLGRAGGSLPTRPALAFQLAHARARDAVQRALDTDALRRDLARLGPAVLEARSAAPDRAGFIARPDLGRALAPASAAALAAVPPPPAPFDAALVVADGLSARAAERHAAPLLAALLPRLDRAGWRLAPLVIVTQGRVAVADEIGAALGARMAVILLGERPGLSSPDSLGAYLTWAPRRGRTNAERNCISNIREPDGLGYAAAAHKLFHLMHEARRRGLSGVDLKEDAPALDPPPAARLDGAQ
ncbi:MAG: ethanolamine ammonia-lyase subunit EutC [Burkholderiales bacterium]|nr:ethanolamine ammonia-lyase subunit EutC [Burkholderiales bacterium]